MFDRILVPLDGSDHSLRALDEAVQIAKKFNGKLVLMHVYSVSVQPVILPEPATLGAPGVPVITANEISRMIEATKQVGNRILSDGEAKAKAEGLEAERSLVEGHTVEEIVKKASTGKFDLIVIGARGVSHIREMLLGSVTDGVIHHVSCPVLVVK